MRKTSKRIYKLESFLKKNANWLVILAIGAITFSLMGLFVGSRFLAGTSDGTKQKTAAVECRGTLAEDFKCWRTRYQQIVNGESPKAALADARKNYKDSQFIKTNCHEIAHVIGRAAGKKYKDVSAAFVQGDDFCASGYYHGVMQAITDEIGAAGIAKKINEICEPLRKQGEYKLSHYNCVHGLGHGFMAVQNNELFKSLELCEKLSGNWQQDSCYSGVFMENIIGMVDPDHHTQYLKDDDPLYPCPAIAEKYKRMCYFLQTDHALRVENGDFAKVFNLCSGLEKDEYSIMCYQSLGRNASSYAGYSPQKAAAYCQLNPLEAAQQNCFIGAAKDFVWYFQGVDQAMAMCNLLNGNLQTLCATTARDYKTLL